MHHFGWLLPPSQNVFCYFFKIVLFAHLGEYETPNLEARRGLFRSSRSPPTAPTDLLLYIVRKKSIQLLLLSVQF